MLPLLPFLIMAQAALAANALPPSEELEGEEPRTPFELVREANGALTVGTEVTFRFEAKRKAAPTEFKGAELTYKDGTRRSLGFAADWDYLDATLEPWLKYKVEGTWTAFAHAGAKKGVVELEGEIFAGVKSEYEVKIPKRNSDRSELLNPFDPQSMPEGAECLFEASTVNGVSMGVAYRRIALETEYESWKGMAIGVEKLDGSNVRLLAGPLQGVKNSLFLGVALGVVKLGIGNDTELKDYRLKTAVFDVSTDEGLGAFRRAILSGHIAPDEPGAEHAGTLTKLHYRSATGFKLKVGDDIDVKKTFGVNEGERHVAVFPALEEEHEEVVLRYGDHTFSISTMREKGETTHKSVAVLLRRIDKYLASYLHQAVTGEEKKFEKNTDVQWSMTGEEAMKLHELAERFLEKRKDRVGGSSWPIMDLLAEADSPERVVYALTRPSAGTLSEAMLLLSFELKDNVPGILRERS
ncbi:MAG: hypothetical protein HY925_02670 [Elusimicrobia bacterium]|nr:hypothetical protein [Elusimicrobiota bacterium]